MATCAILVAAIHAAFLAALVRPGAPAMQAAVEMSGIPLMIEQVEPIASAALNPAALAPRLLSVPPAISVTANPAPADARLPPRHAVSRQQLATAGNPAHAARQAEPGHAPAHPAPARQTQPAGARPAMAAPAANPAPAGDPALFAALEARIDSAVQAASTMPESAKRQHRQGRARLRFTYLDGAVDDIAVVQSSDSRVLDDAALAAVRRAHYPPAPAAARGRRLNLLVWIDFRLSPEAS